jgi:hypothetical protein
MSQQQPGTIDHQKLRSDLQKLHGELRKIKSLDREEQKMLRSLDADLRELLTRDDLRPNLDTRQRLSESLARVEVSYPRVTLLMRQMVDSLAYLGI